MDENGGILSGLDWLTKQNPSVLIALVLAGISILALVKMNKLAKNWFERFWWTIVILGSFLLIVGFVHGIYTKHSIKNRLTELSKIERAVLKRMIKKGGTTYPNKGSGVCWGLARDGIIYKAGDRNEEIETFNLHHWILKRLQENPDLLQKKD